MKLAGNYLWHSFSLLYIFSYSTNNLEYKVEACDNGDKHMNCMVS